MQDLAIWVNDAILLGTAGLVLRYVVATERLVRTTQQQVESQSQPAIVVKEISEKIELVNIGTGPAIEVEWRFKDRGTSPAFAESKEPVGSLSYIENSGPTGIDSKSLVKWELHCLYRSISGARYVSVSSFTETGIFATRFHTEAFKKKLI